MNEAYNILPNLSCSRLFIDSDVGVRRYIQLAFLKLRKPRLIVSVYEEGVGTYRDDLYRGWKKRLFQVFGVGTYFGGCFFTTQIYVYRSDEYSRKLGCCGVEIVKLQNTIEMLIVSRLSDLKRIFDVTPSCLDGAEAEQQDECLIYLSSWLIDKEVVNKLSLQTGLKIIKPHPHIRTTVNLEGLGFLILEGAFPAELLVLWVSERFNKVTLYHHGSSVERYISRDNVEFIQLTDYSC